MQEAFGGTFMLKLFMVFFVIYVAFIGVALNFAKIYRIKNNVINILEQYQYTGDIRGSSEIDSELSKYLNKVHYGITDRNTGGDFYKNHCSNNASEGQNIDSAMYSSHGICVIQKGEDKKHYYSVTVYYVIEFPILDLIIPISASGETIVIDTD